MKLLRVSGKNGSVGAFKLVLVGFMVLTLVVSLPARQKKRGNDLVITTVDNRVFRAELLTIKGNDLIVLPGYPGSETVVNIDEIQDIRVVRKSKTKLGALIGLSAGAGITLLMLTDKSVPDWPNQLTAIGGAMYCGIGLAVGALMGSLSGGDKHIVRVQRTPEENARILAKLDQYARVPRSYQVPAKVTE
ncbi:MAG: hypothetical protein QHH43_02770 [Candidatus Saccharicenans sp.]|nr:hypothetical protein [Candidatus Saccharicenans sp.]MDH7574667.1 hypothetical protein [Candidatus Saccharicenans sp.]